jgi:hypothetical protein
MPVKRCRNCARDAENDSDFCCVSCQDLDVGIHTPLCNKRTWPEWKAAEYLNVDDAAIQIVERLQKMLAISHIVSNELKIIHSAASQFVPNYQGGALESMVAHLDIDISYLEREARKLLGS